MTNEIKSITFVISSLRGGGAERVLSILANYFVNNGYKIDIVYSLKCEQEPAYHIDNKINIHKLPDSILSINDGFLDGKKNTLQIIRHLRSKMKALNSDVIISFVDKTNIYSIIAHLGLKAPLIISERSSYYFRKSKLWRFLRKVTYPFSDGIVVLSQYDYKKFSFVKNKKIIFNPIDFSIPKGISTHRDEKIILAVGSLSKTKGFDMLIQSCQNLNLKDWKVIILGEGSERDNLEQQIKDLALEGRVILPGRKKNVSEYYKKASIFVLSSRNEGFPNVLAEAMSFGCACVSFDCITGPSEMIEDNVNGFLVKVGDVAGFSEKIGYLMDNESKVAEFSMEASRIVDKLDVSLIAESWVNYMNDIVIRKCK